MIVHPTLNSGRASAINSECPEWVVLSTDRRNTYLGMRAWSEGHEEKVSWVGFTAEQSAELWERWKKGEGLKSIGRVFGKPSSCIFAHIRPSGGIMPPVRRRSRLALTLAEREEISRGLAAGRTVRSMARALGRSPSTVSREIGRNGGYRRYRAEAADGRAWRQALRPKPCKLAAHDQLRQAVAAKLEMDWSPEQIAGWLKRTHPGNEACQVSHETIYRSLYVQARGVLKKDLMQHLRSRRPIRRSRHATQKADQRGRYMAGSRLFRPPGVILSMLSALKSRWTLTGMQL